MRLKYKDYRTTNDGVMVADIGFKRQLRALDPELDVVWSGSKWEIWRFPGQKERVKKLKSKRATHVMTVQTKGRSFRELGADVLLNLQKGDLRKYTLKEINNYFDAMDDNIQRAKAKEMENWFTDRRKEFEWYGRGLRVKVPERFLPGSIILKGPSKAFKIGRAIGNG